MLRLFLYLFLFLYFIAAAAQDVSITGRVLDQESGEPIRYAQVYSKKTHCGTATNTNGEFILNVSPASGDELIITAMPFETTSIKVEKGSGIDILLRKLKVTPGSGLDEEHASAAIENALENSAANYYTSDFSATTFHREYVSYFNSIIQSFEGIIESDPSQSDSRAELKDAVYSEDKRHRASFYNPSSGGFYTFGWNSLPGDGRPSAEYFLGIRLKAKNDLRKYYDFNSPGVIREPSATTYVITFDQKETIKGALLKGTIFIDSASQAIVKLEYSLSPHGVQYVMPNRSIGGVRICLPPQKLEIIAESGEVNYKKFGNKWHLASQIVNTTFNASLDTLGQAKNEEHFLKLHSEKVVTRLDTIRRAGGDPSIASLITHDYIKSNFEGYEHDKTNWAGENILKSDTSMHAVTMALRANNILWERNEGREAKEKLDASTHFKQEQLNGDLEYLRKMFLALHPSLQDGGQKSNFNRMIGNTQRQITRGLTGTEFARYLSTIVESLHCGHTQLHPSAATDEYNRRFGKYFPFDIVVLGRRAFLSENVTDTARGSEIMKINGTLLSSILQNLRYKVSTEGVSTAAKDHQLGKNFASLYATHYLQTDSFKIELKNRKTRSHEERTFAARNFRKQEDDTVEPLLVIDSIQTVMLKIPGNFSETEMKTFLERIIPLINEKRYTNLIIDLRDSDSFKDSFGSMLYSAVSTDPFTYYNRIQLNTADSSIMKSLYVETSRLQEAMPTFTASIVNTDSMVTFTGHNNLKKYEANPDAYHGNLYVLVNGGSNSAATEFAKFIQLRKRGQVVGQEINTGSHGTCDAGQVSIMLPASRIRISLPLATYHVDGKTDDDSRLIPDHIALRSIADIVEKRDKELEICRDLIIANCCSAKSN